MVFQYAALFDSFSAIENIAFPMREFTDWSQQQIEDRCTKAAGIRRFGGGGHE